MAGVTEPDAVLKVAEIEVPVNPDGTFTHTIKLDKGENIIKVTATDMVGNATKQDVIIYRTGESSLASGGGDFWTINPNKKTKKGEYVCPNCLAKFDRPVKFCGKCGEKMS